MSQLNRNESRLFQKELFRVDEIASYFSVTDRTVRGWILNGHLKAEKIVGIIRIARESVLEFRENARRNNTVNDTKR